MKKIYKHLKGSNDHNDDNNDNIDEHYDDGDDESESSKLDNNNNNNNNSLTSSTTPISPTEIKKLKTSSPQLYYLPPNKIGADNLSTSQHSIKSIISPNLNSSTNSPINTSPTLAHHHNYQSPPYFSLENNNNDKDNDDKDDDKDDDNDRGKDNEPQSILLNSPSEIFIEIEKKKEALMASTIQESNQQEENDFLNTIKQIRYFKFQKKHKRKFIHYLLGLVPIVSWLPQYNWKKDIKGDLVAGLTVGVMLIPQGMAYAMVAGLPPIYGLYSSIMPVLAYAIFGTSKQLSVGPFAIISLLVSETVNREVGDNPDPTLRVSVAILLSFVCGILQVIFGLLRFGFVANFLADPVKTGFTSGCALIIGSSQIKHILAIYNVENSNFLFLLLGRYLAKLGHTNWWSFLLGMIGIAFLYGIKKINTRFKIKIPGPLLVVFIFTFVSWILDLEKRAHISVVGTIPSGLPHPEFPIVREDLVPGQEPHDTNFFNVALRITPGALVLVLVGFISSVSIGAKFGEKYHYQIDPNQELLALGTSDLLGSFFCSFPVGASLSRTAVNAQSGAVSQIASIISTIIIICSVLFLTPIVYFLPKAILASIVIVAIVDLVEYQVAFDLWKVHRKDLLLYCISFFSTICLGILQGILIGMVASLLMIIYRSAYPPFAVLGRLPGTEIYKNIKRVHKAETFKGIQVVRIDGSIYFANTAFIKKKLRRHEPFHNLNVAEDERSDSETEGESDRDTEPIQVIIDGHTIIGAIIIDFSSVNDIDSTGIRMLKELVEEFRSRQLVIYFASVKGYVRDSMKKGGVVEHYGADHFFWTINDAVEHHLYLLRQAKRSKLLSSSSYRSQRNTNSTNSNNSNDDGYSDSIQLHTIKTIK